MRRIPLVAVLAGTVFLTISAQADIPDRQVLLILPLGKELPFRDIALVKQALVEFFDVQIRVLPRVDLPEQAYYHPRRRYRAEKLLPFLTEKLPSDGHRILGLTGVDISAHKGSIEDWGIIGAAKLGGKACIISSFRFHSASMQKVLEPIILAKIAVHEVGHTLGLGHCPTRGCLMEDSGGMVRTCNREFDICLNCRNRLRSMGHVVPDQPHIPWPRP